MFKDIDEWMFGDFRANRQRTEERHVMDTKRMQSLLDSAAGRTLMNKARAAAMDRGEGLYGGRAVDPYVKGSEDLGKIRAARDKFAGDELTPETAAYFTAAEKSVLDRMKSEKAGLGFRQTELGLGAGISPNILEQDNRDFYAPGGELDVFEEMGAPKQRNLRLEGQLPATDKGMFDRLGPKEYESLEDYFQAPTETVPEGNIPKTFQQIGIESVDEQATLQEMQKALPDVDMKNEYENNPEYMQKLIKLWREGKLNKQNLHKAFSIIQGKAQKVLGVA